MSFRFVGFSTVTQQPLWHADTAERVRELARAELGADLSMVEVLDCGDNGEKVWTGGSTPTNPIALYKARRLHRAA